jgi:hypothetical protein
MSRSAPRHAAPKHARTGPRAGASASTGVRSIDLGQVRHHAAVPARTRSGSFRAARLAAVTAAVVAVSGGGYVLSQAAPASVVASGGSGADIAVVSMSPTPATGTDASTQTATHPTATSAAATPRAAAATPTPRSTTMRGAGTVALTDDTLAARARAAAAAQAAKDRAAAAAKAAEAAKERAAEAARSSRSSDRTPVPSGSPKAIARAMLANYGWGDDQFSCLVTMWNHESGWNPHAENPGSGAYGIPQALPGPKMASAGADWRDNPATQISWGLKYIKTRYSTPCGAWSFWQRGSWY